MNEKVTSRWARTNYVYFGKPLMFLKKWPFLNCPCHIEHILSEMKFICLRAFPLLPVPKWVLHRVRSSPSSFNLPYPLFFLRSSNSCLSLLPRLPITSVLPSFFPSIKFFFLNLLSTQDLTCPTNLHSLYCL